MGEDNGEKNNNAVSNFSASRRTLWWGLCVFAAVCTAAHFTAVGEKKDAGEMVTRADKWSAAVMIITMALAFIACCAHHFFAEHFVDKMWVEGSFSLVVLGLWAAGMAAIMSPNNGQAVDAEGGILNANLYFFAWASLAAAVWIFCSVVTIQAYFKRDDDSATPPNMTKWYMLVAASAVVMVSSIRLFNSNQCQGDSSGYCKRVKYATSLGAVAMAFGLFYIVASDRGWLSVYPDAGLTFTLFVLYVAGIAVITFGDGPGIKIGNLYFSTWIGFVLTLFLTSKSWNAVREHMKGKSEEQEAGGDEKAEEGEAEGGDDDKKVEDAPPEAPLEVTGESSA